ncbi:TPA: hypothetical protein N0F65_006790 [Lagenidium giganteum]|uniref:PPM-type phosphatase domain-containing protein n=1 Tax=Lagenidium giganteum TaxID=4803 RepID=A0AAV2Z8A6_9STRA|nr:TPA: hypothetical protein N0F65_006790 [Lagenidium giganteum]
MPIPSTTPSASPQKSNAPRVGLGHSRVHTEQTSVESPRQPGRTASLITGIGIGQKADHGWSFTKKIAAFVRRGSVSSADAAAKDKNLKPPTLNATVIDSVIVFDTKRFAVVTSNGVRMANEDRFRVISNLELYGKALVAERYVKNVADVLEKKTLETYTSEGRAPKIDVRKLMKKNKSATITEYYGIYDGHGGDMCSSMLALLFPLYVMLSTDYTSNLEAALRFACDKISKEILMRTGNDQILGGSTATSLFIRDRTAYICHTGDCRAILLTRSGVEPLTIDHKAANEDEKKRIEAAGGLVLYVKGVARVNGRLVVTRAFGDAELQQYINASPDVIRRELSPDDEYIVMASDGLWDTLTNEQVQSCIRCVDC